jgi:hypothetical protein
MELYKVPGTKYQVEIRTEEYEVQSTKYQVEMRANCRRQASLREIVKGNTMEIQ